MTAPPGSSRRRFLRAVGRLGAGGLAALAGCVAPRRTGERSVRFRVDDPLGALDREGYGRYAARQTDRYGEGGPGRPGSTEPRALHSAVVVRTTTAFDPVVTLTFGGDRSLP